MLAPAASSSPQPVSPRRVGWWAWLWPSALRRQVVWVVSGLLMVTFAAQGLFMVHEQTALARRQQVTQANSLAQHVAALATGLIRDDQLDLLERLTLRASDFEPVVDVQLLTNEGHALTHVQRSPNGAVDLVPPALDHRVNLPTGAAPLVDEDRAAYRLVAWYPVDTALFTGWVRLVFDASSLQADRDRIWWSVGVAAALAVGLCAGALVWFFRRPMHALERATRFAQRLPDAAGGQLQTLPACAELEALDEALNETSALLRQQRDVIDQTMARLQRHQTLLAEQNDQLGAIFALSPDGLLTLNRLGQVQFVNQAFLRLTGWPAEQLIGQSEAVLATRLADLAGGGGAFEGLAPCFDGGVATLVVAGAGGAGRVLTLSGQRSDSGSVGQVLYLCDVTRQHQLDQMKSDFLSMAAHELRTPMVSIFGFTELLMKRKMSPERQQDLLGSIYRHSQSMVSILNELLDLARIESRGGQDLSLAEADLAELVGEVIRDFKPPQERESPQWLPLASPVTVRVDRHKLQQAVLNVLSNAYKYSPQGGAVTVRLRHQADADGRTWVGVAVQDEGMGLSPEHVARMGERFFRVDKSGAIPGTGLGVSIVKELLELMGGYLAVESTPGQGSTFTLWL